MLEDLMYEYGEFSRYKNEDGTTSCYRDLKFIGAFENTSAFCDLYTKLTTEIVDMKQKIEELEGEVFALNQELYE